MTSRPSRASAALALASAVAIVSCTTQTPVTAAPQFTPTAGSYSAAQSVTLASATPGASIVYTLDGSRPTRAAGTAYAGPIQIATTSTVNALAFAAGHSDSPVSSATYTIVQPQPGAAATPVVAPPAGTYVTPPHVTITTATAGASIRYTLDGSTPSSTAGQLYAGAFDVTASATLRAIAFAAGLSDSPVVQVAYVVTGTVAAPGFTPGAGPYTSAQSVTISTTTPGSSIRYTTDGSDPSSGTGTVYAGPVTVSSSETIRAIAYQAGWLDSAIASAAYTITLAVAAPTFTPPAGTYGPSAGQYAVAELVTIASSTPSTSVRYTTDGSAPSTTNGTVYTGPVQVLQSQTLRAIAYTASAQSAVSTGAYTMVPPAGSCTAGGSWCWSEPRPQGNRLKAVWACPTAACPDGDVWVVGFSGAIQHWDGNAWSSQPSGTRQDLNAVWGSSATDVWAAGIGSTVLHWNGTAWSSQPPSNSGNYSGGNYTALWGTAANDVWLVGGPPQNGQFSAYAHWNGNAWTTFPEAGIGLRNPTSVWGSGANDYWAVGFDGNSGDVGHWTGGTDWTVVKPPGNLFTAGFLSVRGTSSSDIWALGGGGPGGLFRWNGTSWTAQGTGFSNVGTPIALLETSPTDLWIVTDKATAAANILHSNGTSITTQSVPTTQLTAISGRAANDIWAVSAAGDVRHWDGSTWAGGATLGSFLQQKQLYTAFGTSLTDAWAAGESGVMYHWDGSGWTLSPAVTNNMLYGGWAASSSDAWLVGTGANISTGTTLHWNGSAWSSIANAATGQLLGVWGSSSTDVWAVGEVGHAQHWDGSMWTATTTASNAQLNAVWGSSSSDVWGVGQLTNGVSGTIYHSTGPASAWTASPVPQATPLLYAVWGSSATDVWAVGRFGTILRNTGSGWVGVTSPTGNSLLAAWGSSATDVWASGATGTLLHWQGSGWAIVDSGSNSQLQALWGSSAADVWAAGWDFGVTTILHHTQ